MKWFFLPLVIIGLVIAFFRWFLPFGGRPSREERVRNRRSANYRGGKFTNAVDTEIGMSGGTMAALLREQVTPDPSRRPRKPIKPLRLQPDVMQGTATKLSWFGHSTFMLQIGGKTLLLDPMLGASPSPLSPIGPKRYSATLPLEIDKFPHIDAVLISHDHYDHLDYWSVIKLKDKVGHWFVPLGVGAHLRRWDVEPRNITELDWWDEHEFEGLKLVCTPARHFSGRTLTDRFATLWASWVIQSDRTRIFFSGDTGYAPHFKEIGRKYGPFDLTLLECGQYHVAWADTHMLPEDTVKAHLELRGRLLLPMHWGAFSLSLHSWTEPVERARQAAKQMGVDVVTPRIGAVVTLGENYPTEAWWKDL